MCAAGKRISHFRGRELHGKALKVPEGYRGTIVEKKEAPKPETRRLDQPEEVIDLEAEEEELPLGALEAQAEFDELVIWGHEAMADAASDPYARGVEEWIQFSEQVGLKAAVEVRFPTNILTFGQIHAYDTGTEKAQ